MRKYVSHIPHVLPWNLRMIRNNFFGYMGSSFTDNFKIPDYGVNSVMGDAGKSVKLFVNILNL